MRFEDPLFFLLLVPLAACTLWMRRRARARAVITFPGVHRLSRLHRPAATRLARLPFWLMAAAAALLIVALARPQTGGGMDTLRANGIDIVLAVDTSSSMDITDMAPTRLEAAKEAMRRFIGRRGNDRIGLVAFSGTSFTLCPLTFDYDTVKSYIGPLQSGMVEDGTAIGMAIASAVARLKASTAKSRVVVLLTDGMNNRGSIDPLTAAELARAEGVKVYTVGVGTRGVFNVVVDDPLFGRRSVPVQSDIDDTLLRSIAERTGGAYFSARNERELDGIYETIDRLEKSDLEGTAHRRYTERFGWFAAGALLLALAAFGLEKGVLRELPS